MKVVITGATGMVGEGVLLECLDNPEVDAVVTVARRPCGHQHPKLRELIVPDFRDLSKVEQELRGLDACFYCAGISSVGLTEERYTEVTYDTVLSFSQTLLRLNPGLVMVHISGAYTDGTEKGRVMWARVKGRAENALMRLPFRRVYNFRISLTRPDKAQKHLKGGYLLLSVAYSVLSLFFPGMPLRDVARAMLRCVRDGAPKQVLEARDIRALAAG